jgi:2'-5' RNA ligase
MEVFTQKYTIAQLLEPMAEGTEYASADWPLHVTIAGIFEVDLVGSSLVERLRQLLARYEPFTAVAAGDAHFGPKKQTRVTLLETNEQLTALHYEVVALLRDCDAVFTSPQFNEDGFRAHASVRPHARLQRGDVVRFRALTVIDMFPDGDPYRRKILSTLPLQG